MPRFAKFATVLLTANGLHKKDVLNQLMQEHIISPLSEIKDTLLR